MTHSTSKHDTTSVSANAEDVSPTTSESSGDIDSIFHKSRVINNSDENITIRPIEILATYDIQECNTENASWGLRDPNFDVHDGCRHLSEDDPIPPISTVGKRESIDDTPMAISTRHYVRCESPDLVGDIYVPFGIEDDEIHDAREELSDLEPLIGEQSIEDNLTFDVNTTMLAEEVDNVDIDRNTIRLQEDMSDSIFENAGIIDFPLRKVAHKSPQTFDLLGKVFNDDYVIHIGVLATLGVMASAILSFTDPISIGTGIIGMTIPTVLFVVFVVFSNVYKNIKNEEKVMNTHATIAEYPYQTERPDDARTVVDEHESEDSTEQITVEADVDTDAEVCRFVSIDGDSEWNVDLDNGLMTDELTMFFESIGGEKVDEQFVVVKRSTPTEHSVETNTANVYLAPPEI